MNLLLLAAALVPLTQTNPKPVTIGTHYTDDLAGLAVYRDAKESVLLTIAWVGKDGKLHQGYRDLVAATVHFGEAAPDDSYHRISWTVDSYTVTYEWGLTNSATAVGKIRSSGPVEIRLNLGPAWPTSKPTVNVSSDQITAQAGDLTARLNVDGQVMPSGSVSPNDPVAGSVPRVSDSQDPTPPPTAGEVGEERTGRGGESHNRTSPFTLPTAADNGWQCRYLVAPGAPIQFTIGAQNPPQPSQAGPILVAARAKYMAHRLWAEGDWGDFLSPIENQMGNSKVYSIDTGRLAHIVSRQWCLPDGQVLFCWDSFFNGLLSSLEDPDGAKKTVRAILAATTPAGFVPNYAGRGWGTSIDRSQPPDGSYCVWKIHQRQPDIAFLKEAYPKLLKWHQWWFAKNEPGRKADRDGNGDGLLEWGSETKDLQNAKFESGLDDSPMFDDGVMVGPNMNLDSTDLNALWAMDARYLAYIADAVGKNDDAAHLRKQCADMARLMDQKLWNQAIGTYCYRYWTPKKATESLDQQKIFRADNAPGLAAQYFNSRNLSGTPILRHDKAINFDWDKAPMDGLAQTNFSVRWTATFTTPKTDPYVFRVVSDDGARLWMDGKLLIDAWTVHAPTTYASAPTTLKAGQKHNFKLEYFQAEGGAQIHLAVERIEAGSPGQVFSSRLSPLNFYPMIVDAPSKERGRQMLDLFFRPDRFGGNTICPTISRNDPAFPAQGYWRGTVWGPTSYLTFQGVRNYATAGQLDEYASKSVALFMKNWNADGTCHENFNAITGWGRSDPHYTWGALLCLLGLEELCDTTPDGQLQLNGASGRHIKIHNLRLKGRIFDLTIEPKSANLTEQGKTVAVAQGKLTKVKI